MSSLLGLAMIWLDVLIAFVYLFVIYLAYVLGGVKEMRLWSVYIAKSIIDGRMQQHIDNYERMKK